MRTLARAVLLPTFAIFATGCPHSESKDTSDAGAVTAAPASAFAPRGSQDAASIRRGPRLYVSDEASGEVTIIDLDTNTVAQTLSVGKRPRGIQKAPDGSAVYVALSGSVPTGPERGGPEKGVNGEKKDTDAAAPDRSADGIGILSTKTGALTFRLPSGTDPEQLAVSVDGTHLFVSNEDAASMSVIGIGSKSIEGTFRVGEEPEGVGVSPDGKWVYVTCEATSDVHVYDIQAKKMVAKLTVPGRPRGVAFLPDGARAYVTSETGGAVSVVRLPDHKVVKTLKPEGENVRPMGVAASPDGKRVYVTTGHGGSLVVIDTSNDEVVGTVAVGKRPWGVIVSGDGKTVYTANGPSDDVSVVDAATLKETSRIKVGKKPWGLVLVPREE